MLAPLHAIIQFEELLYRALEKKTPFSERSQIYLIKNFQLLSRAVKDKFFFSYVNAFLSINKAADNGADQVTATGNNQAPLHANDLSHMFTVSSSFQSEDVALATIICIGLLCLNQNNTISYDRMVYIIDNILSHTGPVLYDLFATCEEEKIIPFKRYALVKLIEKKHATLGDCSDTVESLINSFTASLYKSAYQHHVLENTHPFVAEKKLGNIIYEYL